jgi:TetR/AcrR family acrAB operon transcriptional repressor
MARKTKENSELTRQRLIEAARKVFLVRGVSRTTMEHIAVQAGVTRGAIYWHFNNKLDLFQAMREQVFLPLIDRMDDTLLVEGSGDPLTCIENFLCGTIQVLADSVETREIYEIMMIKCEYVDEFSTVLQQILSNCSGIFEKLRLVYERAEAQNQLHPSHDSAQLAIDTHLFFIGLLHMWVKDTRGDQFRLRAIEMVKAHMGLRRRDI